MACGILVPQSEIEHKPLHWRAQSLNHWTTWEVACLLFFVFHFLHDKLPVCSQPYLFGLLRIPSLMPLFFSLLSHFSVWYLLFPWFQLMLVIPKSVSSSLIILISIILVFTLLFLFMYLFYFGCSGFSLWCIGSLVVACGLSWPEMCGILIPQPGDHQGSPMILALLVDIQTPTSNLSGAPQTHQAELTSFLEAASIYLMR